MPFLGEYPTFNGRDIFGDVLTVEVCYDKSLSVLINEGTLEEQEVALSVEQSRSLRDFLVENL